jgi:hypothetical protein
MILQRLHLTQVRVSPKREKAQVYEEVAKKVNARYGALRVFPCDQVYRAANDAFDQYTDHDSTPISTPSPAP